ncbi:MAG: MFS transporter [Dehalococcoidia bacterium]|nr:MAG: MFS transporter [Dehalococcoidia bacterium]
MTQARKPQFFYGYIVVVVAFFIMTLTWGTFSVFGVFFKPLLAEFGWTRAMTSGAFSFSFILIGLLSVVMGRLTDRFGPRIVITACGAFLGLGYLLMSQIGTIWHFYLVYGVIIGVGMSGVYIPLVSTIARWFARRRGVMTGIALSGIGFGVLVVPLIVNWLIAAYDWRTAYAVVGIAVLILTILAAQFLRREPSRMGQTPYGEGEVKEQGLNLEARELSLWEAMHTSQLWMLGGMFFCFSFGLYISLVHIVPHATELGISAASAANILATIGGVSIVGRLVMGVFADKRGNKLALIVAFAVLAIALFWLQLASEAWMLYLFAALFGFAYGGLAPLESPLVAELFGLSSHGVILGVVGLGFMLAAVTGPVLAGGMFDVTGSYSLAFLACAIVSVIGLILALLLKPVAKEG